MRLAVGTGIFELSGPAVEKASNELHQRLSAYLCEPGDAPDWKVEIAQAYEPIFPWEKARWIVNDRNFSLEFTVFSAQGSFDVRDPIQACILDHDEPETLLADRITGLIRSLCTELWRAQGTLAFHGAAVELLHGEGVMALGISGAGKSTFATGPWIKARRSDDHALLEVNKGYSLPGVPFSGREGHKTTPGSSTLSGFVLPRWTPGSPPSLRRLSKSEATEVLLANLLCIDQRTETFEANISYVASLVSQFPMFELSYDASLCDEGLANILSSALQPLEKAS